MRASEVLADCIFGVAVTPIGDGTRFILIREINHYILIDVVMHDYHDFYQPSLIDEYANEITGFPLSWCQEY